MTVLRRPHERARRVAREVLWECGIDEPSKIDPMIILGRRGIRVSYGRLDGAAARIFRHGDHAIIRVSDQIVDLGRRRFTLAHEAGHFLLGHRIPTEVALETLARAPFSPHQERDADVFATEYLMPTSWVLPLCKLSPTFSSIRVIAKTFRTSIVASAIRYVELTDAPCAIAYSEAGRVVWRWHSRTFAGRIPHQVQIGAGSVASADFETAVLDAEAREVPATTWFGRHVECVDVLVEESEIVREPCKAGVVSLLVPRMS